MNCTLHVQDSAYTSYFFSWEDENNNSPIDIVPEFHPLHHKWLHDDCISINTGVEPCVTHSPVRTAPYLCGVLLLEGNKTFGRNANKKRLLYRVIPASPHLPHFLVPYDLPAKFVKAHKNKYVLFAFASWEEKHPWGTLVNLLGDVDQLDAYYEYQLYSKQLHHSLKAFSQKVHEVMKHPTVPTNKYSIVDRTHRKGIFSIDPLHSTSFDDALDIECIGDKIHVTVYLANVVMHLETLQLWKFLSQVASIYLPDRRRPMLPNQLAEGLCSLQADKLERQAVAIDFVFTQEGIREQITFHMVKIQVRRNYVYDDTELDQDSTYQSLLKWTQRWKTDIASSHALVAHWMTATNHAVAQQLHQHQTGIYRTVAEVSCVPPWLAALTGYKGRGQYQLYKDLEATPRPSNQLYAQTTSPIRRLVDVLNQTMLCATINIPLSDDANTFIYGWTKDLNEMNKEMQSIRKLQIDCMLLHQYMNTGNVLDQVHEGMVFDKVLNIGGGFSYMVYIKKYHLLSRFRSDVEIAEHTLGTFRMYLFETEHRTQQKIRLEWVNIKG